MTATESSPNHWAEHVADAVRTLLEQTPQQWLDPRDFGRVYRYSADQAGHVLRRAYEYGALERTKEGRRFVYRPAPRAAVVAAETDTTTPPGDQ